MLEITDLNSITKDRITIIDFYADWCMPCKAFAPTFHSVSLKYEDITFSKVNVDYSPQVATHYSIKSIPTIIILKDGVEVARKVGSATESILIDMIDRIIQ